MSPERHAVTPLRARETAMLAGLLAGKSTSEAAKDAGMSRRTGYRVLERESFQLAYRRAKSELLSAATSALHSHAKNFIETLAGIATDKTLPGSYRVAAAREGLAAMFRAVEAFDVEQRLSALEAAANEGE